MASALARAARARARCGRDPPREDASSQSAFISRNHRVEALIQAAVERDDYALFEELLAVLARPFDDQAAFARYMEPPQPHERICQTFCGT